MEGNYNSPHHDELMVRSLSLFIAPPASFPFLPDRDEWLYIYDDDAGALKR